MQIAHIPKMGADTIQTPGRKRHNSHRPPISKRYSWSLNLKPQPDSSAIKAQSFSTLYETSIPGTPLAALSLR